MWIINYTKVKKYDKQDQQGKAAFNERNLHMTNGKEPRRTPNKNRTGQRQRTDRLIIK
jgi:hypothetical protein